MAQDGSHGDSHIRPAFSAPEGADGSATHLRRRAFQLEYATIAWNIVEGLTAILAGLLAGSVALLAFGLDSLVEVFASSVVVWELRGATRERERLAVRLIGGAYLVVAVYVLWDSVHSLLARHRAEPSVAGIVLMVVTVLMMVALALGKRRTGAALGSPTVLADARFSLLDAGLSGAVLLGLLANALLGWWWADQALAILLAILAAREGVEGLHGEHE